jgi:OmpA-OmpF porin, OOP family
MKLTNKERNRMPESIGTELLRTLDKGSVSKIANYLAQSEQSILCCLESSIIAVVGGIAGKSEDLADFQKIVSLLPCNFPELSWPLVAGSLSDPKSPLIGSGNRILSDIFGSSETALNHEIGKECGLAPGKASLLLAMAAPVVVSFVNRHIRDKAVGMRAFGALMHKERDTMHSALPPSLAGLAWPRPAFRAGSPVIAQPIRPDRSFPIWIFPLALFALALGCFWLLTHPRQITSEVATSGSASRLADDTFAGTSPTPPDVIGTHLPKNSPEARLLALIQNPAATSGTKSQVDFRNLLFDSGLATPLPEAGVHLDNIADILKAFPNVHLDIYGYTDDEGSQSQNLKLSRDRAEAIKTELVARGISSDRLTTEGLGDQNPMADNSTEVGRIRNRRVALQVTQK